MPDGKQPVPGAVVRAWGGASCCSVLWLAGDRAQLDFRGQYSLAQTSVAHQCLPLEAQSTHAAGEQRLDEMVPRPGMPGTGRAWKLAVASLAAKMGRCS